MCLAAFVWQLWRANLADLMSKAGGDKRPDEKTIVKWMNDKVTTCCAHALIAIVIFADQFIRREAQEFQRCLPCHLT